MWTITYINEDSEVENILELWALCIELHAKTMMIIHRKAIINSPTKILNPLRKI